MKTLTLVSILCLFSITSCQGQQPDSTSHYEYRTGDLNGIDKWYMGRQIAHVMGHSEIDWLERAGREEEEKTSKLLRNMDIQTTDTIADIGAGSGYHSFQMAEMASRGLIYALDIQPEMLEAMEEKKKKSGIENVAPVMGTIRDAQLGSKSVDKVLMVDVYHEFSHPREMMLSIVKALKDDGELYLIEYRAEHDWVPIKPIHKMSQKQAVKEMESVGLKLKKNIGNLPWQHCMVFVKG